MTSPAGDKHGVGDMEGLEEAEGHIEVGSEVKDEADGETCNDEARADISKPSQHLEHPIMDQL